jgi:hypothetical protein
LLAYDQLVNSPLPPGWVTITLHRIESLPQNGTPGGARTATRHLCPTHKRVREGLTEAGEPAVNLKLRVGPEGIEADTVV